MTHNHCFKKVDIHYLRKHLLQFYDEVKRDLPWRHLATTIENESSRAYSVWVSEIMLQQTQVATVVDYYNKWMKKWPSIASLSDATIDEVNEMWAGLGYYSRARRLLEGAKKISSGSGEMPKTSKDLMKEIPGVGRYTAGAIASIAYKEQTGVVDGNVVRVLSRLLQIGADSAHQSTIDLFWETANEIVDKDEPGNFNQAMMELGATVCTPKSPCCNQCPLKSICRAYGRKKFLDLKNQRSVCNDIVKPTFQTEDIEDVPICKFCLPESEPYDKNLGVMNYPRKRKKKAARAEKFIAVILRCKNQFILQKRPEKGLLAGLWEFPMIMTVEETPPAIEKAKKMINIKMKACLGYHSLNNVSYIGDVSHVFSHLHHTYHVYHANVDMSNSVSAPYSLMTTDDITSKSPVSTGIKKIFKLYCSRNELSQPTKKKRKSPTEDKTQRSIDTMFSKKKMKNQS